MLLVQYPWSRDLGVFDVCASGMTTVGAEWSEQKACGIEDGRSSMKRPALTGDGESGYGSIDLTDLIDLWVDKQVWYIDFEWSTAI